MHAVVADRGEVVEQGGGDDAARAEAHHVDVVAAGDLARRRRWPRAPRGVGVEVPVACVGLGLRQVSRNTWMPSAGGVLDEAAARAQVEEVEAADRRRDDDQRARVDLSVVGGYWMSSPTSSRCTTAPGDSARSSPTSNASRSTIEGMPPLLRTSPRSCATPRTRLKPPVSNARLSAAGLPAACWSGPARWSGSRGQARPLGGR